LNGGTSAIFKRGTSASIEFIFDVALVLNKNGGTSDSFDDGTSDYIQECGKVFET
jgi:hypothetical protein